MCSVKGHSSRSAKATANRHGRSAGCAQDFFGTPLPDGVGLAGYRRAGPAPQALKLGPTLRQFVAERIPITPYDDAGAQNFYPRVRVIAREAANNTLAEARVVLPVSDEKAWTGCHGSNSQADAMPAGWLNDPDPERDYRRNILRVHDEKQRGSETRCLRGVMGNAAAADGTLAMQCQSCHGGIEAVDKPGRVGWPEQPNCQVRDHDGRRETDALDANGAPRNGLTRAARRSRTGPHPLHTVGDRWVSKHEDFVERSTSACA